MTAQDPNHKELFPGVTARQAELIVRYYDNDLFGQEIDELREALQHSADVRDAFVRLGLQSQSIAEGLAPHYSEPEIESEHEHEPDAALPAMQIGSSAPLTKEVYASALSYVLEHTFTPKRVKAIAGFAAAAVLLLGVVLAVVLLGGPDDSEPLAEQPFWIEEQPTETPSVATLTAQADAQWRVATAGAASPKMGDTLHAGQRLTLVAGVAQITTRHGAVAVVEAPCTIAFTDSPNAIRLDSGRLVGRCLTMRSRGFTVTTPSSEIVDLGTEFAVEVDTDGRTDLHVFDGLVSATPVATPSKGTAGAEPDADPATPQLVRAGQAVTLDVNAATPAQPIAVDAERFTRHVVMPRNERVAWHEPAVHWSFDALERGGSIRDQGPGKMHLQAGQGAVLADARHGRALVLAEEGAPLTVENGMAFGFDQPFTIEAWLRVDEVGERSMRLIANNSNRGGFGLAIGGSRFENQGVRMFTPAGDVFTGGRYSVKLTFFGHYDLITEGQLTPGRLCHVVAVIDGQGVPRIYIDGVKQRVGVEGGQRGDLARVFKADRSSHPVVIGNSVLAGNHTGPLSEHGKYEPFVGMIDELAVYPQPLSESDVLSLFNAAQEQPLP